MIILLQFLTYSCGGTKYKCVKLESIEKVSTEILTRSADSIAELRMLAWKEKDEAEKEGLILEINFQNSIYFEQNCNSTSDLESSYHMIGSMLKYDKLRIQIIGNSDSVENKTNSNISRERAEFIQAVFIKNGIKKNRIELIDGKSDRPFGLQTENGNKENRRVDFVYMTE
ncbi:OmpA family protein [uncultured Psychroserpens sp.]|uniref:OmpA family protein n=1 Tax=uncultured Psychroserpens sp. TaxID=255436 RepID=UPI002607B15C|nr:OmpA family protein [uncultured Psychroserpens sp.]